MGGGGTDIPTKPPAQLRGEAAREAEQAELSAGVNQMLVDTLTTLNDRDTEKVKGYLDEIREALRDQVEDIETLLFGGSVAKHTYVDGLSDIDSLVVISGAGGTTPQQFREEFAEALRSALGSTVTQVKVGDMAVTVEYPDGTSIQLLPAIREGEGFAISSPTGSAWKRIEPERFAKRLTAMNQAMSGTGIPVIKLAKSAIGALPADQRPSGYQMEALAIAAFENYKGPTALKDMLSHFFKSAAENVLRPIHDVTGQSSAVDDYMGEAHSMERQRMGSRLARIGRSLDTAQSVREWERIVNPPTES